MRQNSKLIGPKDGQVNKSDTYGLGTLKNSSIAETLSQPETQQNAKTNGNIGKSQPTEHVTSQAKSSIQYSSFQEETISDHCN